MSQSYKIITPASTYPVTVAEAKGYLRVDWADDDALIDGLIARAVAYAEAVTHRAFALQRLQVVETIERPPGGELSGPFTLGPSWYQFNEQLGANPFGPAQFTFDLPKPPIFIDDTHTLTIETKVTAFDSWVAFTGQTYLDDNREPARLFVRDPITANFYRFTYTAGYTSTYPLPADLRRILLDLTSFYYDHRGDDAPVPESLTLQLLSKRVDWL